MYLLSNQHARIAGQLGVPQPSWSVCCAYDMFTAEPHDFQLVLPFPAPGALCEQHYTTPQDWFRYLFRLLGGAAFSGAVVLTSDSPNRKATGRAIVHGGGLS